MQEYLPSRATAKAVASAIVVAAAYLVGVIPAEGGFGDVTTVQWLGLVVFMGGAYGITYAVPNRSSARHRGERGEVDASLLLLVAVLVAVLLMLFGIRF